MLLALPLAAAALGAWAYGTYEPNSPLFGRAIGRGSRSGRVAYLTFDDGPNVGATERILETLAAHQVPAAFFMVGGQGLENPLGRSEEHTPELQSHSELVCRLLLEKKKGYVDN